MLPCGSAGKGSAWNAGDLGLIPGLGRSPGEGKGYSLQYSGMENFMDCIGPGVTKSWTQLSNFHFHFTFFKFYSRRGWNGYSSFCVLHFIAYWRCVFVYQLKVCGNPVSRKPIGTIFPVGFAHFWLCVTFWWPVIKWFYVSTTTHWRFRWWLAFSSNKLF